MSSIRDTLSYMTDDVQAIGSKVRGIAAEKQLTQQRVADIIGVGRKAVGDRYSGTVEITAVELLRLSRATDVNIASFFPQSTPTARPVDDLPPVSAGRASSFSLPVVDPNSSRSGT